jgi:hypothetical protein
MLAAGMLALFASMRGVALSRLGMMRTRLMLVIIVRFRSFAMIFRGLFVVIGSVGMMFRRRMFPGHLRFSIWILALERASLQRDDPNQSGNGNKLFMREIAPTPVRVGR